MPHNLHIQRRRQAEIQRLTHDVRRQKVNQCSGKFAVQNPAQLVDIFIRRGPVAGLQLHHRMSASPGPITPLFVL